MESGQRTAIIACGALAREILALTKANGLDHVTVVCVPATLHNRPQWIPDAVRRKIHECRQWASRIYVALADCGTGGKLDDLLEKEGVPRIGGPHCYAFYAGQGSFADLSEAEPGTLYLTDFLARHFETLIIRGLGLDRHPELRDLYFGNYRRLIYLAQTDDDALTALAMSAAQFIDLEFERQFTGYGELAEFVAAAARGEIHGSADDRVLAGHSGSSHRPGWQSDGQAPAQRAIRASHRSRRHARRTDGNRRLSRPMAEIGA